MLRSPLQRLKNKHVERSLQQLNPVFILLFLAHRCRHSTRMEVDCLLPHNRGHSRGADKAALVFAEEVPEFVDHGAGTIVETQGRKLIRDEHGSWREVKPN